MKIRLLPVLAAALGVVALSGPLVAHHADSEYDRQHPITLQGTVTAFEYINPHPHVYFEVKDEGGNVEKWIGESGAPPSRMYNSGWRANAIKPGDVISITGSPSKDGRKMMRIRKIVSPSGQTWTEGPD